MANILNAAEHGGQSPGVASGNKSEAQALFDRLSAVRTRLASVARRLDDVKGTISTKTAPGLSSEFGTAPSLPAFFEGIDFMAREFEQLADALDASVEDLAKLF